MSRKNFGAKPYSFPQPVFIITSYGENGIPFNNAYHVIGEKVGDAWGFGKKFM